MSEAAELPVFRCRNCHHGFEARSRTVPCPRCGARDARPWRFPVLEEDGPGDGSCERPAGSPGKAVTPVGGSLVAAVTRLRPR